MRTGEVQQVFLDYELHQRVYQAAELMGASVEELDAMIAYPRAAHYRGSLLEHSAGRRTRPELTLQIELGSPRRSA